MRRRSSGWGGKSGARRAGGFERQSRHPGRRRHRGAQPDVVRAQCGTRHQRCPTMGSTSGASFLAATLDGMVEDPVRPKLPPCGKRPSPNARGAKQTLGSGGRTGLYFRPLRRANLALVGTVLGLKREIRRRFPYRSYGSYGKASISAGLLALFGGHSANASTSD